MHKNFLRLLSVFLTFFLLTACDENSTTTSEGTSLGLRKEYTAANAAGIPNSNVKLAYTHALDLEMPPASVEPRFTRARDACLQDTRLNCALVSASFNKGNALDAVMPFASLSVRLPHDQVAVFEQNLTAALPNEAPGESYVASQTTAAEDLTKTITDADRREAQLTDYRDRLTALSKRPDAKVEDLVKIESELSSVQSQLETLAAEKKALNDRIATELLTIQLQAQRGSESAFAPVTSAIHHAGQTLGESAGHALRFGIASLPWLPIVGIIIYLLVFTIRRMRRKV